MRYVSLGLHLIIIDQDGLQKANQVSCFQTVTTPATHKIIKDNIHLSVHIQETKKGQCIIGFDEFRALKTSY